VATFGGLLGAAIRGTASNQGNKFALGVGVAVDVALGHAQAGMAGELLHIAQGATGFRDLRAARVTLALLALI
jgi:hypothetical protein